MSDHPKFDAFKAERLKNPEIKAAYDEAVARNDLAAILAKHESKAHLTAARNPIPTGRKVVCACGEWWLGHALADDAHRAHVAQMVLESDWLRGVRAKELRDAADEWDTATGGYDQATTFLRDRADRVGTEDGGR